MRGALTDTAPDSSVVGRLAGQAASRLALGAVACVSALASYRNYSYHVSAEQGGFLLRLHRRAACVGDVAWEHTVARHVRQHGIRTPVVLDTFSGDSYVISIYEWITGTTLAAQKHVTPAQARQAGEYLARIHGALQGLPPATRAQTRAGGHRPRPPAPADVLKLARQTGLSSGHCRKLALFLASAAQLRHCAPPRIAPEKAHWLHGDFTSRNILLSQPEWTILDWEDSIWRDPAWDLAIGLLYVCDFPERAPGHPCARAFLAGYGSRLALTEARVRRTLWQACFVLAPDTTWLLACLAERDLRPLAHLARDQARLDRLRSLAAQPAFGKQLPALLLSDGPR